MPEIRILLGGDVMLSRGVLTAARNHNDYSWPFREIAPLFRTADISFLNLESPFTSGLPATRTDMVFRARREMIAGLATAGIHAVSTANNHARDAGSKGIEFTVNLLREHGIEPVGTGLTADEAHAGVVIVRKGIRFGFLGYTFDANNGNYTDVDPRVATMDVIRMRDDVMKLRRRSDVMIVSMHAGWEYHVKPNPQQMTFAKAAIDAGASVVVGHHPHVSQPWQRYANGAIYYSLGNLVFDQTSPSGTRKGLIADITFRGGELLRAGAIEVEISGGAPHVFTPGQ